MVDLVALRHLALGGYTVNVWLNVNVAFFDSTKQRVINRHDLARGTVRTVPARRHRHPHL